MRTNRKPAETGRAAQLTHPEPMRPESGKRRDILDGARRVFFDKGFDGASMDEVARSAGVSKATIYVYFSSKEDLFEALVHNDRAQAAEHLFEVDPQMDDIAALLRRIGISFMTMMVEPDHVRLVRMVIGIAEKFPLIGRSFFESGPCLGGQRLADLLRQQADRGRLTLPDAEAAAHLFLNMCHGKLVKGVMFSASTAPSLAEIEASADEAVRVFLAGYGTASRT